MTQTYKTWSILLFVIVVLLAFFWYTRDNQQSVLMQFTPTPSSVAMQDWSTLSHSEYTLRYPKEAKGEVRDNEAVIVFMGQKQIDSGRTQTELFDGYSFRVGVISSDQGVPLAQLVKTERENAQNNCQTEGGIVSDVRPATISGQAAFQYSVRGCYIDYTETFLRVQNTTYRISQSYVGEAEDQATYQAITDQILSSLTFKG